MGMLTTRSPLATTTCSIFVPTTVENGRSPVRFWSVMAVGISSCACAGGIPMTSESRRRDNKRVPLLIPILSSVQGKCAVRKANIPLNAAELDVPELAIANPVLNVERLKNPSHGTIIAIDRRPYGMVLNPGRRKDKMLCLQYHEGLRIHIDVEFGNHGLETVQPFCGVTRWNNKFNVIDASRTKLLHAHV